MQATTAFKSSITFLLLIISVFVIASPIDKAKQALEKRDYSTAIIHLKNQLKNTPKNAQARFLLGDTYLRVGKNEAGLKELGRAHQYQPTNSQYLLRYADALQANGKYKDMLTALSSPLKDNKENSQRLAYIGYAHFGLNEIAQAKTAFEQSNEKQENAMAYNGLASLSMRDKKISQAQQYLDKSLQVSPDNVSTLQLKAKLANINQQPEQALSLYNQLIEKNPNNLSLYLERATTLLILKKDEQAKADIEKVLKKIPHHPQANLLMAQLLIQEKDFTGAVESAQKVLNVVKNNAPATFILGTANFALKHYHQADHFLTTYLATNSNDLRAQSLLASVYLAQQQPQQALLILEGIPAEQRDTNPLVLLTMADSYSQLKQPEKAIVALSKAKTIAPDNIEISKRLIAAKLQAGKLDEAVVDLEKLTSFPDSDIQSHYLLISTYISQKQLAKAKAKVSHLLADKPKDIQLLALDAMIEQQQGNTEKARAIYQSIITQDKNNIPAYMGLAQIAVSQSNWLQAEKEFKQILSINPDIIKAYLGLAAIAEKQNQAEKVEKYFKQALALIDKTTKKSKDISEAKTTQTIQAKLLIAKALRQWYQKNQHADKTIILAKELNKQHPQNTTITDFLIESYLLNKDFNQAEVVLNELINSKPRDIKYRLLLANLIAKRSTPENNRINQSILLLDDVINIVPNDIEAYLFKTALLIKQKQSKKALSIAKTIQSKFPDSTAGVLVEADIYRAQKQYKKALPLYQQSYQKKADDKVLVSLTETLISLKQDKQAIKLLTSAVAKNPTKKTLFILASLLQKHQQFKKAQQSYEQLIALDPENIPALNNLAWLYVESDTKKAVKVAKQASDLAPKSAAIMDTYGFILVRDGQNDKGIALIKKAVLASSADNDILYHLAYAYNALGNRRQALKTLQGIVNSKTAYTEQENAKKLYQQIK